MPSPCLWFLAYCFAMGILKIAHRFQPLGGAWAVSWRNNEGSLFSNSYNHWSPAYLRQEDPLIYLCSLSDYNGGWSLSILPSHGSYIGTNVYRKSACYLTSLYHEVRVPPSMLRRRQLWCFVTFGYQRCKQLTSVWYTFSRFKFLTLVYSYLAARVVDLAVLCHVFVFIEPIPFLLSYVHGQK